MHEVAHQVPHGVSRSLVPPLALVGLLRSEDINKPIAKQTEIIGILDMRIERCRVVLREYVNTVIARIEAIGNRNIHQPVFAGDRHRGFRALFGQWIQPCTLTSPQYYRNYTVLNHNLFGYFLIKIYIGSSRLIPGEIERHQLLPQLLHTLRIRIQFQRTTDGIGGIHRVGFGKSNAVTAWLEEIPNRVFQSARASYDWYRTVTHGIQLVEPARFYARGHDEEISRSIDVMCQFLLIAHIRPEFAGVLFGQMGDCYLHLRIARAQHHDR